MKNQCEWCGKLLSISIETDLDLICAECGDSTLKEYDESKHELTKIEFFIYEPNELKGE